MGKLPSDLLLVRAETEPSKVELSGPKTILGGMWTLYTTSIPLNDITDSGEMATKLVIPSAFLKLETGYKDKVEVKYEVRKRK